jgi:hypothetical protein
MFIWLLNQIIAPLHLISYESNTIQEPPSAECETRIRMLPV